MCNLLYLLITRTFNHYKTIYTRIIINKHNIRVWKQFTRQLVIDWYYNKSLHLTKKKFIVGPDIQHYDVYVSDLKINIGIFAQNVKRANNLDWESQKREINSVLCRGRGGDCRNPCLKSRLLYSVVIIQWRLIKL